MSRRNIRQTPGDLKMKINGQLVDIFLARIVYKCIHCLGDLEVHNAGVRCSENSNHYGFIHRDDAIKFTEQERFMKISEMFPSEYLRGVDITEPRKMRILKVDQQMVKSRDTGKFEPENILMFEGESKKMRLNLTTTKKVHFEIFELSPDVEPSESWPGKYITVFWTKTVAFGKVQVVPDVRKPKPGDTHWPPQQNSSKKEKPLNTFGRSDFWAKVKAELALPTEVSKFVLIQAGLDGEYKQENAPKMWDELSITGKALDSFLNTVLSDVPFYSSKAQILDVLSERRISYVPSEQFELEAIVTLEEIAKIIAQEIEAENGKQITEDEIPFLTETQQTELDQFFQRGSNAGAAYTES